MKNPSLPADQERPHKDVPDDPKPPSETTIKTVKKTGIAFITVTIAGLLLSGLVALNRSQVNAMLVDYETKDHASEIDKEHLDRETALQQQCDAHAKEVESLRRIIVEMDKKVDHLTFTLDWMQQHQAHNGSPKDQP